MLNATECLPNKKVLSSILMISICIVKQQPQNAYRHCSLLLLPTSVKIFFFTSNRHPSEATIAAVVAAVAIFFFIADQWTAWNIIMEDARPEFVSFVSLFKKPRTKWTNFYYFASICREYISIRSIRVVSMKLLWK